MLKKIVCISVLMLVGYVSAQEDAWVYFTDKENVNASINNPITILTQRAIDRKAKHNIAIDERDVPVNESYITQLKNAMGITVYAKSKWFNVAHVRGSESDINALLDLGFVERIVFANKNLGTRNLHTLTDKFEIEDSTIDFTYGTTENQVDMLNLQMLHQQEFTGVGVTIAVLDSGFPAVDVMASFQNLRDAGNLLNGYDFVHRTNDEFAFSGSTHGTKVLSTMAAFVENQYVGTAPEARYYLFRTEDVNSENPVEESYWVEAAERADSLGVDIINTSLGYKNYDNPDYSYNTAEMDGVTAFVSKGATMAAEKGILVVTSAGNSGSNGVIAPADAALVFSIGAVDENGNYATFSSQGSAIQPTIKPDVVARGRGSFVIGPNDVIVQNNGTSFSSPIMAGAMACLVQALPILNNKQLRQLVRESATQFNTPDFFLGHGIPDFDLALLEGLELQMQEQEQFKVFPNPVSDILSMAFPSDVEQARLLVYDVLGQLLFDTTVFESNRTIDFSSLSSGIYFVKLSAENVKTKSFQLIKK